MRKQFIMKSIFQLKKVCSVQIYKTLTWVVVCDPVDKMVFNMNLVSTSVWRKLRCKLSPFLLGSVNEYQMYQYKMVGFRSLLLLYCCGHGFV